MVANTYEGKARELAVVGLGGCQSVGAIVGTIGSLFEYHTHLPCC